jgi:hypothetical protein
MSTISAGKVDVESITVQGLGAVSIQATNLNFNNLDVSGNLTVQGSPVATQSFVSSLQDLLDKYVSENNSVDFNRFCFQGCTFQNRVTPTDSSKNFTDGVRCQDSTFELCRKKNVGHYINMGDQIYGDYSFYPEIIKDSSTNEVRYIDYNALWNLYVDSSNNVKDASNSVIINKGSYYRLYVKKTASTYDALYSYGISNMLSNKERVMESVFNGKGAKNLRNKIGYRNFLWTMDDHDFETNDIGDSLCPLIDQTMNMAKRYAFGNDPNHPQIIQMQQRKAAGWEKPGLFYTVAYELAPNKYVQVIGLDNRTFRTGTVIRFDRFLDGSVRSFGCANAGDNVNLLEPEASRFIRKFSKGDSAYGREQFLWLRDVLQKNGHVPAYTKEGYPKGTFVNQSQIIFRCFVNPTAFIAGSGFKDRASGEESCVFYHLFNGGDIIADPSGVVTCVSPKNYTGKTAVNGIISFQSGNHVFEYFRGGPDLPIYSTNFPDASGITLPYNIYDYHMGNWSSNTNGVVGPVTEKSTNTFTLNGGGYDVAFRRGKDLPWNAVSQPSAVMVEFDLSVDGEEKAIVKCLSWGNQTDSIFINNTYNNEPFELVTDIIKASSLRKV